jgi:2-polyprenyl-3-methyl-5-hydroxy-6-metoxy-1,4-benzoquinol methylase
MENTSPLKPGDPTGLETLEVLSEADKFNEWMYNTIKPYCKGPVLEIGSGIGNISQFFMRDHINITLTDLRDEYCDLLRNKFAGNQFLLGVEKVDLVDSDFDAKFSNIFNSFQTVYALNVVEHIENDLIAIQNCKKLLKKDGNLVILVPAYNFLYNKFDEELGHFKRYTKSTLSKLFTENKFKILHKQYFNMPAMFGWFWYGKVLGRKILPKGPIDTYNKMVPIFKIADKIVFNLFGNSVIVVGKKEN